MERMRQHAENAIKSNTTIYKGVSIHTFVNPMELLEDQVIISVFVTWESGKYVGMEEDLRLEPDGFCTWVIEYKEAIEQITQAQIEIIKVTIDAFDETTHP